MLIFKMEALFNGQFIENGGDLERVKRQINRDANYDWMTYNTFYSAVLYGGNVAGNEGFRLGLYSLFLNYTTMQRDPPILDQQDLADQSFDDAVNQLWRQGWKAYTIDGNIRFIGTFGLPSCAA